jgi:hypothetical protein
MLIKTKLTPTVLIAAIFLFASIFFYTVNSGPSSSLMDVENTAYACGVGSSQVRTSIDFSCHGNSCVNPLQPKGAVFPSCKYKSLSPIADILFSLIRFLSVGVGLVIIDSMVVAGIQYMSSRGEPQGTQAAITRIRSNIIALLIFIFAYAILSFVVPPGYIL